MQQSRTRREVGMTPLLFLFFALALGGSAHSSAAPRGDNEQQANQATRARDFFVSPDGSDSHDGSRAHPWKSITHAAKMASPGTTVHVLPGIYDEVVVTEASGNSQDRIKYVSQLKWKAVISPAAHGIMAWKNTGDYTDVDGFDIAGSIAMELLWEEAASGPSAIMSTILPRAAITAAAAPESTTTPSRPAITISSETTCMMLARSTLCAGIRVTGQYKASISQTAAGTS